MVWFAEVHVSPDGNVPSNSQVTISPGPVDVITIGAMAVLLVAVVFTGLIFNPGT